MAEAAEAAAPAEAAAKPVLKPHHPPVVLNIVRISGSLFHCNFCPDGSKAQKSSGSSSNIYTHIAMKHREASALLKRVKGANQYSYASSRRSALLDVRSTAWLLGQNYHTLDQYQEKLRELEVELFDAPKDDEPAAAAAAALPAVEEHEAATVLEIARRARAAAADVAASAAGGAALGGGRRSRLPGRARTQVQRELALYVTEASFCAALDRMAALGKWRKWHERWPRLARLAAYFACIPPGSIAVERLFSMTGRHIDPRRQLMSPEVQQRDAVLRGNPMLVDEAAGVSSAPVSKKNK